MSGVQSAGKVFDVHAAGLVEIDGTSAGAPSASAASLMPPPFTPHITDDLATSLALMMMQQRHESRVQSDAQARTAAKAQDEAHARKIDEMHELADDTFAGSLIGGILEGVSAVGSGVSAVGIYKEASAGLLKSMDAAEGALKSAGRIVEASYKREVELDNADIAVAGRDLDRAKAAADAASSESRRAQDDIRETVSAIRSYLNAKTQLAQAGILRG